MTWEYYSMLYIKIAQRDKDRQYSKDELRKFYRRLKRKLSEDEYTLLIRLHKKQEYEEALMLLNGKISKLKDQVKKLKTLIELDNNYLDLLRELETKLLVNIVETKQLRARIRRLMKKPYYENPDVKLFKNPYLNNYPLPKAMDYKSWLRFIISELQNIDPFSKKDIEKLKALKSLRQFSYYTNLLSHIDNLFMLSLNTALLDDETVPLLLKHKHLEKINADMLEQYVDVMLRIFNT